MKFETIKRHAAGAYHDPDDARLGLLIKDRLSGITYHSPSALEFLTATFLLPAGAPFYAALRRSQLSQLWKDDSYLSVHQAGSGIKSTSSGRSIVVPNFIKFQKVRKASVSVFLKASDQELAGEIFRLMNHTLTWPLKWQRICSYLEATLLGAGFSPALIAHVNFVGNYAPISISEI